MYWSLSLSYCHYIIVITIYIHINIYLTSYLSPYISLHFTTFHSIVECVDQHCCCHVSPVDITPITTLLQQPLPHVDNEEEEEEEEVEEEEKDDGSDHAEPEPVSLQDNNSGSSQPDGESLPSPSAISSTRCKQYSIKGMKSGMKSMVTRFFHSITPLSSKPAPAEQCSNLSQHHERRSRNNQDANLKKETIKKMLSPAVSPSVSAMQELIIRIVVHVTTLTSTINADFQTACLASFPLSPSTVLTVPSVGTYPTPYVLQVQNGTKKLTVTADDENSLQLWIMTIKAHMSLNVAASRDEPPPVRDVIDLTHGDTNTISYNFMKYISLRN